jgi:hypothetical protein
LGHRIVSKIIKTKAVLMIPSLDLSIAPIIALQQGNRAPIIEQYCGC